MEKINEKVIQAIQAQIGKHLSEYQKNINVAYDVMGEVSISLSCKLIPEDDNVQIQTNIAFVESKVKDKGMIIV
jgi:predicted hydrolase (HD superfamily)